MEKKQILLFTKCVPTATKMCIDCQWQFSFITAQNGVVVKISDSCKRPTAPDRQHKRVRLTSDTVG